MLTVTEKILLLDEVGGLARSAWQIHLSIYEEFCDWPSSDQLNPAYLGYINLRNILSVGLMTSCYSLIETGSRSYSLHHAMSDSSLKISLEARSHCDKCFELRQKISKYRNNVVAHVNSKRSQADWAQASNISNGEIDRFIESARFAIEELSKDNLEGDFSPCVTMPVQDHFRAFCRLSVEMDDMRRLR